jgi:hypothetical protein
MEVAAFLLLLAAIVLGKVVKIARPRPRGQRVGLTIREIGPVFLSLAASLSIYIAVSRFFGD